MGANAHAVSVRIGVVHGFLVYIALIVDSNYGFHTVLVDAGNGKVFDSAQLSIATMLMRNGMMMRNGVPGSGTGITFGHPSNTTGVIKGSSNTTGLIRGPAQSNNPSLSFLERGRELYFAGDPYQNINCFYRIFFHRLSPTIRSLLPLYR